MFSTLPRSELRRLVVIALAITGAWIVAGFFFGSQHQSMINARGHQDNLSERQMATMMSMLIWALLTPIVIYIADLFPLRKSQRLRSVLLLIPIAILIAAVRSASDAWLPVILEGIPSSVGDYRSSVPALFHTHLLFVVLLIGIANFARLQREAAQRHAAEARVEAELAQARLSRLRADLHPHFLFNALNSVAGVIYTDPAAARQMLTRLSDLLGYSLARQEAREVPLGDELAFVDRYLDILRMRFGNRLTTSIVVDPELAHLPMPPLLLQPLVENAVVHGIAHRRDGGTITIRAERAGFWLRLQVRDNGPGLDPKAIPPRRGSIGVPNVRARLESLYGGEQSLTYRREGDELVAEIRIRIASPAVAELSTEARP